MPREGLRELWKIKGLLESGTKVDSMISLCFLEDGPTENGTLAAPPLGILFSTPADLPFTLPAGITGRYWKVLEATQAGIGMGDLRNKVAKQMRDEAHRQWLAKHFPSKPLPKEIVCDGCGASCYEIPVYAMPRDWKGPYNYACAGCMSLAGYGHWGHVENPDRLSANPELTIERQED